MKSYPSIEQIAYEKFLLNDNIVAFNKYDGSNFRVEWNFKWRKDLQSFGFTKFGTRNNMITADNPDFGETITIFMDNYAEPLNEILSKRNKKSPLQGIDKITCFFEFLGENSFAGSHNKNDDKDLILIDVFRQKKGFLIPHDFISLFEDSQIKAAEVIYEGKLNKTFIKDISENVWNLPNAKFPTVKEGVVCKNKSLLKGQRLPMCKIKTSWWLDKLKAEHPEDFDRLK